MGKGAVFFDIDGTWLRWQLFDDWIHKMVELGIMPKIVLAKTDQKRQAYKRREGTFDDFVNAQIVAYQGDERLRGIRLIDAQFAAEEVMREKGRLVHVLTDRLSQAAKKLGYPRVIISGSPREVVQAFADFHEIKDVFATEHPDEAGVYTGGSPREWCLKKAEAVKFYAEEHDIDLGKSIAIGDSPSDAQMFELVRYPICFNPNSKLLAMAREKEWPVIWEKKDIVTTFRIEEGALVETGIEALFPESIAEIILDHLIADARYHP